MRLNALMSGLLAASVAVFANALPALADGPGTYNNTYSSFGSYQPFSGASGVNSSYTPNDYSGYSSFPSAVNSDSYLGLNNSASSVANNASSTAMASPLALRGRVATIPDGTTLMASLDQPISSFTANLGDPVSGKIENDVFVNDAIVIPAGSEVLGQVANVSPSGRVGKHGEIDIKFFSAKTPQGNVIPLRASIVTKDDSGVLKGNSYAVDVLKGVGIAAGATGVGAVMGTAAGGLLGAAGSGAVFGTGVGALAGGTYALMRKGKDVLLPRGARVTLMTTQTTSVNPM
ncbi:MAG: hypothetical protein VKJ06_06145 [Vampirovibrionales bacterium]|nr:hypothetical protein [Vampirovibrionales bacterium]